MRRLLTRLGRSFALALTFSTPALAVDVTYQNGSYIIDMGQSTPTAENSLKPYGLVYDLTTNYQIPVDWIIRPGKSYTFESLANAADFTYNGKNYYAGPLIIPAEYAADAKPVIDAWVAKGVVVDEMTSGPLTANAYGTITSFPRVLLDAANGSIAASAFFEPAEVPTTAYALGEPLELTECNDIYILPHADPQSWDDATKTTFSNFVSDGGYLWSACHAVGSMEADAALGFLGLEMLTTAGLEDFGAIDNSNTTSYSYDPDAADDPIMQFYAALADGSSSALSGGSQEVNVLDLDSDWRATTTVAVSDPTNPNVAAGGGSYPEPAGIVTYGPTFGTGPGFVVYETSHSIQGGTDEQNVSAARIIGNFLLQASIAKKPIIENFSIDGQLASAGASIVVESFETVPVSADVGPADGVTATTFNYQWTSTCGGVFDQPSGTASGDPAMLATNWTAPADVGGCIIRLTVEDDCGRVTFEAAPLEVIQPQTLMLAKSVDKVVAAPGDILGYTLVPDYTGSLPLVDLCVSEDRPANTTYLASLPAFNTGPNCTAPGNWYLGSNTAGVPGVVPPTFDQQVYTIDSTILANNDTADTYLSQKDKDKVFGTEDILITSRKDGEDFVSLVGFDIAEQVSVASLPAGWEVASATMAVTVTSAQDNTGASVFRMLSNWSEAGASWSSPTGIGTWKAGEFSSLDYVASVLGLIDPTTEGLKTVDLTTTVDGWLRGNFANYGVALVGTLGDKKPEYAARELQDAAQPGPALDIVLNIPNSPSSTVTLTALPALATEGDVITVVMEVQANLIPGAIDITIPALATTTSGGAAVTCGAPSSASVSIPAPGGAQQVTFQCTVDADDATLTQDVVFDTPAFAADDNSIDFAAALSNSVIISPDLKFAVQVDPGITPLPNQIDNTGHISDSGVFLSLVDSNLVSTVIQNSVDLAIAKTVDIANPVVGTNVVFTLAVSNNGPGNASGVLVDDPLPSGYVFVGYTASQGTYDGTTWSVGSLASGATATIDITAEVQAAGDYLNTATVSGNEADADLSNNVDTAGVLPGFPSPIADVALNKSVDNTTPIIGSDTVTFTIAIINNGPDAADNVQVSDTVPAGYTVTGVVATTGSAGNTGNDVSWTVGTLSSGQSESLSIQATVNETGPYDNSASVTTSTPDPDSGNNIDTTTTSPTTAADLSIVKDVDNATPDVGTDVTFSLTVSNAGPSDASSVQVVDTLPSGYAYVSNDQGATWNATARTLTWAIGDLADQASAVMQVVATVLASGDYTNTATVDATETDPDGGDNTDTAVTTPSTTVDLSIEKLVDNASPTVGDTVTYTLTIANAGPSDETNAVVTDVIPGGYTYLSNDRGATYAAASRTLTWNIGNLGAGQGDAMQVMLTVNASGDYANTATIDGDEDDSDSGNNSSTDTISPLQSADLEISKLVDTPRPAPGDTVQFTVTATNNGPSNATGVVVTDALPGGYSLVSATPSKGNWSDPTWTVGTLANGETATLAIVATVNDVALDSGGYANSAEITGTEPDPDPDNNIDTAITSPDKSADVAISKTVDDPTPVVGSDVTFTLSVTNNGPDIATDVVVTDSLPAGYTFVSGTPQGPTTFAYPTWTVGTLYPGDTETLLIVATVEASGPYANTATVTTSPDTPDPDGSNNTATETTNPVTEADLAIDKVVNNLLPMVGDTVVFALRVVNNGPNTATNVVVNDLLPPGYAYISDVPSTGTYTPATGVWSIGTLANGAAATLQITAQVVDAPIGVGSYLNKSVVSGSETDPDPGNNNDNAFTVPLGLFAADVQISKTVDNAAPVVGSTVTFTLTATNNGPDPALGVQASDMLPSGYTFVSAVPSGSTTFDAGTSVWSIGVMSVGQVETLQIVATVNASGSYNNVTNISSTGPADPDPGNNTDSAITVPVTLADLAVVKTVNNQSPAVGDNVTFGIAATNNGPNDATGVVVTDYLPVGYAVVSATPSAGSVIGNTWVIGDLANGTTENLQLVVTVLDVPSATQDDFTNRASVSGNETDPDSGNNTDSAFTDPSGLITSDVVLEKTVDDASPLVGSDVVFTLTASNNGPDPATNVVVTDVLPGGYTFVSAAPSGATTFAGNTWTIGTLPVGQVETLLITATVEASGDYNNIGSITATEPDPDPGNNTDNALTLPRTEADLVIDKEVNYLTPMVGDDVVFSINVTNNGPNLATGVTVTDLLPAGYVYVDSIASQGSYDNVVGIWTVGALANGAIASLQIQATVVDTAFGVGNYVNRATVTGDQTDPDVGSNTDSSFTIPFGLFAADVAITKVVDNPTPVVGENVIFTLTAFNNGPNGAGGVTVSDPLPAGYSFVSATPSGSTTYDPATSVWTIGFLAVGNTETLAIEATVGYTASYDNVATISAFFPLDPVPDNNVDNAITTPQLLADIEIDKVVDVPEPAVNTDVTFTLTVANNGPNNATNVAVTDVLPSGYVYVGSSVSKGTVNANSWVIGAMANGDVESAQVTATVIDVDGDATNYNNVASVTATETDPDTSNNIDNALTNPSGLIVSDVGVAKSVNDATPIVGSNVTFSLIATNYGPDPATNVVVTDVLPAGYSLVSSTATAGTYNGTQWMIGGMLPGVSEQLDIVATVNASGNYNNGALITATEPDPNPGNNFDNAITTPRTEADLSIVKTGSPALPNRPDFGDNITFDVVVTNNGPNTATGVVVTDVLPPGYVYVGDAPSQGSYDSATGIWTVGSLANGASATLTLTATVVYQHGNLDVNYVNGSSVTGNETDPDTGNNTDTGFVLPTNLFAADIAVEKVVDNPTPFVGETVNFDITVTNLGPDPAIAVVVSDLVPSGYALVSVGAPSKGSVAGTTWDIGNMAVNDMETLSIAAEVLASGNYANTATVDSLGFPYDPNLGNNISDALVDPAAVTDLNIIKSVDNASPLVGDDVTFTIVVTNNGPSNATGVFVTDALPSGYTLVSYNASKGNVIGDTWTIGSLANGASATLTVTATVLASGDYLNTATVGGNETDPDGGDNTDTSTVSPGAAADLAISKTASPPFPSIDGEVTFTVTVTNLGPSEALDVVVTDNLPSGYDLVSTSVSTGSVSGGTWNIGNMAANTSATLTVVATVNPLGDYLNTASVTGPVTDPDGGNNIATAGRDPSDMRAIPVQPPLYLLAMYLMVVASAMWNLRRRQPRQGTVRHQSMPPAVPSDGGRRQPRR